MSESGILVKIPRGSVPSGTGSLPFTEKAEPASDRSKFRNIGSSEHTCPESGFKGTGTDANKKFKSIRRA